eukprot:2386102-Alexandrium_andersonii.AAC.1
MLPERILPDIGLAALIVASARLHELGWTRGSSPPHQQPVVMATGGADGGAPTSCLDGDNPL